MWNNSSAKSLKKQIVHAGRVIVQQNLSKLASKDIVAIQLHERALSGHVLPFHV